MENKRKFDCKLQIQRSNYKSIYIKEDNQKVSHLLFTNQNFDYLFSMIRLLISTITTRSINMILGLHPPTTSRHDHMRS